MEFKWNCPLGEYREAWLGLEYGVGLWGRNCEFEYCGCVEGEFAKYEGMVA